MKFIHIADLHLGAKPDAGNAYSQNREQELWDSFRDIITICNQKKTDLLLIAGDLFHRQPLLRELKEMNSILEMLEHTEVVMIAGNHDYIKKNSYYRTFSWASHVHMICSQEIDCVELDRIQTAVYGCSYHSREIHDPVYDHAVPEGRQKYEILLAHGGDEKHIPIKRMATPEEIAGAVAYFASDDAAYTTGQIMDVSGGFGMPTPIFGDMIAMKSKR